MARKTKIIGEACVALSSHKLRTFFMMIAIVIGIASLTAVICIGQGTKEEIMGRVGKHGNDMIMVRPGGTKQVGPGERDRAIVSSSPEDAEEIEKRLSNIRRISTVQNQRNWDVSYQDKTVNQRIFGVEPAWAEIRRSDGLHLGRPMSEDDLQRASRVGILGWTTWRELFGDEDPVGATIRIGDNPFEVIGVFPELGAAAVKDDWDFRVVVPISTSTKRLFGRTYLEQIVIQVQDTSKLHETAEQVRATLRELHGIPAGGADDFYVREPEHIADAALKTSRSLDKLLYAISGIALLIGGIVIMNIMLLSVSERTREIGLRRALGARRCDILGQFLTEALVVTLVGGVLGVACGLAASVLLAEHFKITGISLAVSIVSCSVVALLFGLYPARKAAAVDPVVAMREAKM